MGDSGINASLSSLRVLNSSISMFTLIFSESTLTFKGGVSVRFHVRDPVFCLHFYVKVTGGRAKGKGGGEGDNSRFCGIEFQSSLGSTLIFSSITLISKSL